jgi:hypothetical protein
MPRAASAATRVQAAKIAQLERIDLLHAANFKPSVKN